MDLFTRQSYRHLQGRGKTLKETTRFIDKIIESSAVSMWVSDEKGTAIRANPACLEFFGATEEEVIGKYNLFQDAVIEKQGFMPDIRKVFEKGEAANIIIDYDFGAVDHVDVKNATHKIVESIFTPMLESNGKVSNVIVQAIDLTDIMKAKDELQESQHLISSVFESIQDGISVLAPDLTIRHVNNLMKEWYAENLPLEGKKCYEVYQNRNTPCDSCPTLRCMKSGKTERDIVPGLPGSAVEWIELFSYPMKDPETGKINGAVEFARDVTNWKKAEEALQKSEGKYRLLSESSQDGIYIIGTEGFEYINSAFKKILGYKAKEVYSNDFNFFDTIHPDDKKLIEKRKDARGKGKKLPSIYSFRIITKSGETKHVEVNTAPLPGEEMRILGILRDITDQKLKEAEVKQLQEYLQLQIERMPIGLIVWDEGFRVKSWNPAAEEIFGFKAEEAQGLHSYDLIVPKEVQPLMDKIWSRLLKGDATAHSTNENITKDGRTITCAWSNTPLRKADGSVMGALSMVRNITKRKRAEEALQESEAKYRSIFKNTGTATAIVEADMTMSLVNSEMEKLTGYSKKDIEGKKKWTDFCSKEDLAIMKKYHASRRKGGDEAPKRYEARLINSAGEIRYGIVIVDMIPGTEQSVASILDITDRKQAEEELAKLASIAKYSSELVNLASMDGKMIFLNEAGGKMLGIEPDEVEQINIMEVIPDHFKEMGQTELLPALMQGKTWEGELQYRNIKTGKLIDVYARTFTVMDPNTGKPQFLSNVSEDITARKQAEKKIKASLKEKEVLLQEIHHRVKNNMQIIVSLLRLQSYTAKDKKLEDMFKVAQNRIRSMALIHEKLYQSKDFASIDFAHYIRSLTTHLMQTYQIDPKQITLKTDVKDIHLDINQGVPVGLLINELVSNALKHAFPKGKKGEIIVKFYADKKGEKTLIVNDNGIGHPDKVDISKPETLGMQLIKDLTRQIGGKLALVNKDGTTIKITFS